MKKSIAVTILTGFLITSCGSENQDPQPKAAEVSQTEQATENSPTSKVLSFVAKDTNGNDVSSEQWLGKRPTIINFWGTWCPPCRREIPDLVRIYNDYKNNGADFELISLAVKDSPEKVADFTKKNNMTWVMLMADFNILSQFDATSAVPTTIFYDRNGVEVTRFIGARDYNSFKQAIDAIL